MKRILFLIVLYSFNCFGFNSSEFCPIDSGNEWKYYYSKHLGCSAYNDSYTEFDSIIRTVTIFKVFNKSDTTNFTVTVRDSGNIKHCSRGNVLSVEMIDSSSDFQFSKVNNTFIPGNTGYSFIHFFDNFYRDDVLCQKILYNNDSLILLTDSWAPKSYTFLQTFGILKYSESETQVCGISTQKVQIITFKNKNEVYYFNNIDDVSIKVSKLLKNNLLTRQARRNVMYDLTGKCLPKSQSLLPRHGCYITNYRKILILP